jgi:glycosyltransferase involved in cell wall biosynthesis
MLLRDDETRKRCEKAAAKLAAQYDWSAVATRFEEVLKIYGSQSSNDGTHSARTTEVSVGK